MADALKSVVARRKDHSLDKMVDSSVQRRKSNAERHGRDGGQQTVDQRARVYDSDVDHSSFRQYVCETKRRRGKPRKHVIHERGAAGGATRYVLVDENI